MERVLDCNGTRLWSTSSGSGPGLILLNGGFGCDDYLAPVAAMVEDLCEVVRFEPRGCGRSDYDGRYDIDTMLADIRFVRESYGIERAILCGHSAGVGLALAYATRYPEEVVALIGISGGSVVDDRDWHRVYSENLERIGESYGGKEFVADPRVNELGNRSWKAYIKREQLLAEIARIEVPAVFIYGAEDIRPSWPVRQVAALVPAGEYHEIPGAAHMVWLSHAEELQRLLRSTIHRIIGRSP